MNRKDFFLSDLVEHVFSTPESFSHWFGYYNYSPIDNTGNRLLAHRVKFDGRSISSDDIAEVGWFDLKTGIWHSLGETMAFNWQQGAMLQWLGSHNTNEVIFNDVRDGRFVSRIVNVNGNESRILPWPIYGVTQDGKSSISLQFERSYWCRAYHYESIRNPKWNVPIAEGDGIFHINLENGSLHRIISIRDVIQYDYDPIFKTSKHWLEHIMINPAGTRFAFYHRFDDGNGYKTRVFTSNIDGSELYMVPGWRENSWSHLGWKDDAFFVIFGIKRLAVGKAYEAITKNSGIFGLSIRRIYRRFISPFVSQRIHHRVAANSNYQLYQDCNGLVGRYSKDMLLNDGHPSFTKDGRFMLTDTYADENGYRHLLVFDTKRKKLFRLGKFFSPFNCCDYRSDLHPRYSPDCSHIIIDSAHSGKHQIMVLKLDWNSIKGMRQKNHIL